MEKRTSSHQQQRQKYFDDMRANNTFYVRFLISRCFKNDNCGGTSNRLQDMPYNLMLANQTNRELLVRRERPTNLEHYLVPQPDGINWTAPDDMFPEDTDWDWSLVKYFRNIKQHTAERRFCQQYDIFSFRHSESMKKNCWS